MVRHQADLGPALGRDQMAVGRLLAHVVEHVGERVVLGQLACCRKLLLRGLVGRFPLGRLVSTSGGGFRISGVCGALLGSRLPRIRFHGF